tara:strand:+ start:36386 stop:37102 length:717 start_codon:yes stop_codon:yes gene_type:complete
MMAIPLGPRKIELLTYPLTHNPIKISLLQHYLNTHQKDAIDSTTAAFEINTRVVLLDQLEHHSESFSAINPNKKIPALVDGNRVIWESNAILHYLAGLHHSDLWPTDPYLQTEVIRWFMWESSRWSHCIGTLLKHRVYFPFWGYDGSPQEIEKQTQRLDKLLDLLDETLQEKRFLAGQVISLADISIAAPLMYADEIGLNLDQHPAVKLWLDELTSSHWWQQSQQALRVFREQAQVAT